MVLAGAPDCGKTELAEALMAEGGKGYLFCDSFDSLRNTHVPPGANFVFDEVKLVLMQPDEAKKALDVPKTRSLKVRYDNVVLPAGAARAFSCNCESIKEFLPYTENQWDRGGMTRRAVFVLIDKPLFSAGPVGAQAADWSAKRAEVQKKRQARIASEEKERELREAADQAAARADAARTMEEQALEEVEAMGGAAPWGDDDEDE